MSKMNEITNNITNNIINNIINNITNNTDKDIFLNFETWVQGQSKILYITGLSGSGKTTLAQQLAEKYNAEYIPLDMLTYSLLKPNKFLKKIPYIKSSALLTYIRLIPLTINTPYSYFSVDKYGIHKNFLCYLEILSRMNNKKYVVDGTQLFIRGLKIPYGFFYKKPIIFKNVSFIKATYRRLKRRVHRKQNVLLKFVDMFVYVFAFYHITNIISFVNFKNKIIENNLK